MRRVGGALLVLATASLAGAQEKAKSTAREIMKRVTTQNRAKDEKAKAELAVKVGDATPRRRRALLLSLNGKQGDDKLLIRFTAPADIRGTSLLTRERGADEDQYLFVPALGKVKRIAASGKANRFAGTDFSYEDLRTEELSNHSYSLRKSSTVQGHACHVIEAKPVAKRAELSAYSKRWLYVRQDLSLVLQVIYFDKKGRKAKVRVNSRWKQVQGKWRFYLAEMRDLARKSRTALRIVERQLDMGLPGRLFTPEALKRGG
jgi:hypothetical protein